MAATPPKITILNVDDNEASLYTKSRILRQAGFEIKEAATGYEALKLVAQEKPHLTLLDVHLPDINGIEVCRRIKADPALASTLVLQISASAVEGKDKTRALEGGADGYLIEPVEPEELIAHVKALLRLRQAEEELRALNALLEQRVTERTAFIQLLQEVAVAANEATMVEEAMQLALDRICAHTGWPIGHAYILARDNSGELIPTTIWSSDQPEQFEAFRQVTALTHFAPGVGLPGQVFAAGKPIWVVDVTKEPGFLRAKAAQDLGIKAAFGFPVWVGSEVVQVLEFFCLEAVEPNESLLDVMTHVGTQLGRVVERKRAEETLRHSQVMFQSLFEAAPDAKVLFDSEGHIVRVNAQLEAMFGYDRGELLGTSVDRLLPERFQQQYKAYYSIYFAQSHHRPLEFGLELYGRRKDGNEFPVEIKLSPLQTAKGTLIISAIRDITERKQVEQRIRQSELELEEAQEIAHIGSWKWDIPTNTVSWSDELYRIYGLKPQEVSISYEGFLERVHPDDRQFVSHLITTAYQDHQPFSFEHRIICPDGVVRTLHARGKVVRDSQGTPVQMIGTGQDITERKQVEAELAEMQRRLMESREAERLYLAQELHDGPVQELYGVTYNLSGLAQVVPGEADQAQFVATREMLQRVIQELRTTASTLRPPTLAPFGLEKAISSHADQFQQSHPELKIKLTLTPDRQMLPEQTRLALFRIYQAALNNIVRHAAAQHIFVRFNLEPEQAVLEIQDDGQGFEVPSRWIELARQGHLGLVGMAERAESVGGRLKVVSTPGLGTRIQVTVPRHNQEAWPHLT